VRALIGSGLRSECRSVGSVTDSDVRGWGEEHLPLRGTWSAWYEQMNMICLLLSYVCVFIWSGRAL